MKKRQENKGKAAKGKVQIKYKLRVDDEVVVLTGRDMGKTGKIEHINKKQGKVKLPSINMVKKHRKANQEKQTGEIVEISSYIDISNVMLLCPSCKKGVRVKIKQENGKRKRHCHKCDRNLDKS